MQRSAFYMWTFALLFGNVLAIPTETSWLATRGCMSRKCANVGSCDVPWNPHAFLGMVQQHTFKLRARFVLYVLCVALRKVPWSSYQCPVKWNWWWAQRFSGQAMRIEHTQGRQYRSFNTSDNLATQIPFVVCAQRSMWRNVVAQHILPLFSCMRRHFTQFPVASCELCNIRMCLKYVEK